MIKSNFKKYWIPWLSATGFNLAFLIHSFFDYIKNHALSMPMNAFALSLYPFDMFLPVMMTLPYIGIHYAERVHGYDKYIYMRTKQEVYQNNLRLIITLLSFFSVFLPLLVLVFLDWKMFHDYSFSYPLDPEVLAIPIREFQKNHPIFYGLFSSLWCAFVGVLYANIGVTLSFYWDNPFVVFLGTIGIWFFSETPFFSLAHLAAPFYYSDNLYSYIIGGGILIAINLLLVHFGKKRSREAME